jgi:hypothetical protein
VVDPGFIETTNAQPDKHIPRDGHDEITRARDAVSCLLEMAAGRFHASRQLGRNQPGKIRRTMK